ncbi:hypothetical protein HW555_001550, partial [Spodoptera exigua]
SPVASGGRVENSIEYCVARRAAAPCPFSIQLVILYLWSMLVWSVGGSVCEGELCSRNVAPRIAGGDRSEQNGRPFMVALYSRVGTTGDLGFCGGALVSPEWVITAAHCCFHNGEEVNHVQAILGAHSLYDRYEHGRRVVNVAELVIHPEYDPDTFANDIALLRLANTIQLSDMISTIQLPYRNISTFNFAGAGATVSGWGIAAEGVTFISPTLREKRMTVLTDTFCNTTYYNQLPGSTICTYYGTAGTCKGDNGGPLTIFYNATEEDILIGVTSFISASGCNDDQPSVFTRNIMRAVILLVGCFLTDVFAVSEVQTNYHDAIGIPTAERIKALEEAIQANRNITIEDRIIGGELPIGTTTVSVCSSSLLSPNRVVTAAHCNFDGVQLASEFTVILATCTLAVNELPQEKSLCILTIFLSTQEMISRFYTCPGTLRVQLPDSSDLRNLFVGYWATAVGFGSTSDAQKDASDVLSHVKLQIMENAECAYIYEAGLVTSGNICTSGAGRVGICSGDSGGPLIATDINGTPFLIGISSFRSKTSGCEGGKPSVFTRVTSYMDFIIYHLSHDDCATLVVGLSLIVCASALLEVQTNYHDAIGIPAAEKIKALEEASLANEAVTNNNRIIGGALAPVGAYPYFAGLLINFFGTTARSVCGSSLLSSNRLVTAAHCWFDGNRQASEFTVILGSNWLFSGGERISTRQVFMHPQYVPQFLTNDVAMVYLPRNAMITNFVRPIRLPSNLELWNQFVGHWAVAAGFGSTSDEQAAASTVVSHIRLQVISNTQCENSYGSTIVRPSTLCTSGFGKIGICGGDSGGPLAAFDNNGNPFLIGVSSFTAYRNCAGGHPSGFARVTSFINFINQHLDCNLIVKK